MAFRHLPPRRAEQLAKELGYTVEDRLEQHYHLDTDGNELTEEPTYFKRFIRIMDGANVKMPDSEFGSFEDQAGAMKAAEGKIRKGARMIARGTVMAAEGEAEKAAVLAAPLVRKQ